MDTLLLHPDPKLGVFRGGLTDSAGRFREYAVVSACGSKVTTRRAGYDGSMLHLYVPADRPEIFKSLQDLKSRDPRYEKIALHSVSKDALSDPEERLRLKYDRPGIFWVPSTCPELPEIDDRFYIVPGGRFGVEQYYHDARINLPGARSTIAAFLTENSPDAHAKAERVLSAMRGTTNALANQVLLYGKIFNSTLTSCAGRSQAPCLTTAILETYAAWLSVDPGDAERAKRWLSWATRAAKLEYETVWMAKPRLHPETGLSRYLDESPSVAPEEEPHFYEGLDWDADDVASDAAIREHGWDSTPSALIREGRDRGKPRIHHLLPVCLNSLLFKYESDFAKIARALGGPDSAEALDWEVRAEKRRETMDRLMWNEAKGLYFDVYAPPGDSELRQNRNEELRSFTPLWCGLVSTGDRKAARMRERVVDFLRPGGLATATRNSYRALLSLNPTYAERCQWGHEDLGWPIATAETVEGLRSAGFHEIANEIAYRWCHMVQSVAEKKGGIKASSFGGYEAAVYEKMDVTRRSAEGHAGVGYGNQGEGKDGVAAGFRWGYDAYKLLFRALPAELQEHLRRKTPPDALSVK